MDFKKICQLYLATPRDSRLRSNLYLQLRESYKLLQLKRQKLGSGVMSFTYQPVYLGKLLVGSQFTPEYKNQASSDSTQKAVQATLATLKLR